MLFHQNAFAAHQVVVLSWLCTALSTTPILTRDIHTYDASTPAQVWDHAVSTGGKAIVDGLSRIKRCTFEGRASMSYDLSHVSRAVSVEGCAG